VASGSVARAPELGDAGAMAPLSRIFAPRTLALMAHDLKRLRTYRRYRRTRDLVPALDRLHLGCGPRRVAGWLNVDLEKSDFDVDIARRLPWRDGSFRAIVGQHVIEHLELEGEGLALLGELARVLARDGELWLSCPDMEKICRAYLSGHMDMMLHDRQSRFPDYRPATPVVHMVNDLFHQAGEHKNLFDYPLLEWALVTVGIRQVRRVKEKDLLARFPDFPERGDDLMTLYVVATKG
jgi:predicted SAM-dependent methyltransferase